MAVRFQKLTAKNQKALKPGETISEHGITLERLKNGDGRFTINIMVDGIRIHRVLGLESAGVTRSGCELFIEKVKTDSREDRLSLPKGKKVALRFSDAAAKYLAKEAELNGKDLKRKASILAHHLIPHFGPLPLSKIRKEHVDAYIAARQSEKSVLGGDRRSEPTKIKGGSDKQVAAATINRELAVIRHLIGKAVEWGWISTSPPIKALKLDNEKLTYLTTEQVERVLQCATDDESEVIYPYLLIAFGTAMRMMEILRIRYEDIDIERDLIRIPRAKAGARDQPITVDIANYLADAIAAKTVTLEDGSVIRPGGWLFPARNSKTKNGHMTNIKKPFQRVVEAAGLDSAEVVRHTTRHTAITHLVQAKVDLPTVQRISGHSDIKMVARYSHQDSDHLRSAMDLLQRRYKKKPTRAK